MNPFHIRSAHMSLMVAGLLITAGCGSAPSGVGDEHKPQAAAAASGGGTGTSLTGIHGTLLYTKELAQNHTVDFYEFGEGATAVHESSSLDNAEPPFLNKSMTFSTLAEAYGKLNPSVDEIPAAILQADVRAADARAFPAPRPLPTQDFSADKASLNEEILSGAASTCSADELGDDWGASWFLNNFCITGNFRWCQTNFGWADSGQYQASWSRWTQLEGDFNLTGHINGTQISCNWFWGCEARTTIFDYDVLPRRYETWTFTDGSNYQEVHGTSQCGHLDVAFLHN